MPLLSVNTHTGLRYRHMLFIFTLIHWLPETRSTQHRPHQARRCTPGPARHSHRVQLSPLEKSSLPCTDRRLPLCQLICVSSQPLFFSTLDTETKAQGLLTGCPRGSHPGWAGMNTRAGPAQSPSASTYPPPLGTILRLPTEVQGTEETPRMELLACKWDWNWPSLVSPPFAPRAAFPWGVTLGSRKPAPQPPPGQGGTRRHSGWPSHQKQGKCLCPGHPAQNKAWHVLAPQRSDQIDTYLCLPPRQWGSDTVFRMEEVAEHQV